MITFDEFSKLDIRIATIEICERVEGTDKLLRLVVDVGEKRQIIAGIAEYVNPEEIIGKQIPVIVNLEPRKIRGLESRGMILAVDSKDGFALLNPEKEVESGAKVR